MMEADMFRSPAVWHVCHESLQEGLYWAVSSTISLLHFLWVLNAYSVYIHLFFMELDQLNQDHYGINYGME